ncbi:hypothetical protein GMSM_06520 [Geomonas sp. Red276]
MKTMAMSDFYVWYCEWCDSRNLTPWKTTAAGQVCCGGCHKEFPVVKGRVVGQ